MLRALLAMTLAVLAGHASAQSGLQNALLFSGAQYVAVTNFGGIAPTNEVTVEFWAYTMAAAGQSAFILQPDEGTNRFQAHLNYGTPPSTGLVYWDFGNITGNGRVSINEPADTLTNWIHYAFVASKAANSMSIYTNGVLMTSRTGMSPFLRGAYDLHIGGGGYYGRLDDFRVWSVAHSQAQIQGAYTKLLQGNEPGLLLYYRFDSKSGLVATNSAVATGSAYNGALINGPGWVSVSPKIILQPASTVTATTATLNATVNPGGFAAGGYFQYGTTTNYGQVTGENLFAASLSDSAVSNAITGLSPGTVYHFNFTATNAAGTNAGTDLTFTTLPVAPTVTTQPANPVTDTTAMLNATVNPNGGATSYYFVYGTNSSYGSTSVSQVTPTAGAVSIPISGLTPLTVYHFAVVAFNSAGTNTGADLIFITAAGNPPTATTLPADGLASYHASLNATVNPNKYAASYYFEYGTDTNYGSLTPAGTLPAVGVDQPVSASISGLSALTTYHYRVVASNSWGTNTGADLMFLTEAVSLPLVITQPATFIKSTAASLNGTINPAAGATSYYFQYGLTASYGSYTQTNQLAPVTTNLSVAITIDHLLPLTQYHFQLVASNSVGVAKGADLAFWTPSPPYLFTGHLMPWLPVYTPANASAALKSVQSNDVFYLRMSLNPHAPSGPYYDYFRSAACDISFSVPSRGLLYTADTEDLEVIRDGINPDTIRWDDFGVDSTVAMIFWCRDFNKAALPDGSVPYPLNLTGFHANGISTITLYNNIGANPSLWQCDHVVPVPTLSLTRNNGTNSVTWVTSDLYFSPPLQKSTSLAPNAVWQTVTNAPVLNGLTNTVTLPDSGTNAEFYRLLVL